jgi:glycosyltransferase involved in cell wall biosynthesis
LKAKLISPIRLLSPWAFKSFDFAKYDVIITSATGAYFPNTLQKKKAKLYCYCHTPPRYLYGYATAREWKKNGFLRVVGETVNHFLRIVDFNASKNVDQYIANSEEVRGRIQKFYRRDAIVVYPPVEIKISEDKVKRSYFLTGGRLARAKHVDLIVKACRELELPLKVFGKAFAGYGEELAHLGGKTTEFVGEVNDDEKLTLDYFLIS